VSGKYGTFRDPIIIAVAAERFWFCYLSPLADFGIAKCYKAQNRLRTCLSACCGSGGRGREELVLACLAVVAILARRPGVAARDWSG